MSEEQVAETVETQDTTGTEIQDNAATNQAEGQQAAEQRQSAATKAAAQANGAVVEDTDDGPPKSYWPEDWQEKLAKHFGGDDEKAVKRELTRIKKLFPDVETVYGNYRTMESRFSEGGLVKKPGQDADDDARLEFYKSLGGPEKPEDLVANLKLANEAVLGDEDKPVMESFAQALHGKTDPQEIVDAAANWYYQNLEQTAAMMDERDDNAEQDFNQMKKEEWGGAAKRYDNAVSNLFSQLGQPDLLEGIFESRMADGSKLGNNFEVAKFFLNVAHQVMPAATVTEDGSGNATSINDELAKIETLRREDPNKYFRDEALQARERELLDAQYKIQARA